MSDELLTVAQVRDRYGFTKYKMTALIKRGVIQAYGNPKDARSKRIKTSEVEEYLNTLKKEGAEV